MGVSVHNIDKKICEDNSWLAYIYLMILKVFVRIRSAVKDGKLEKAMYGKIHGDIHLRGIYYLRKVDQGELLKISFR